MSRTRILYLSFAGALVLASLALFTLFTPNMAWAGGVVGDGTPASCTDAALSAAVASGGLVTFNCGPSPQSIIVNTFVISTDTTIDGSGLITLDGENLRQIFYVLNGASLTLMDLTLVDADAAIGGAIYNEGAVAIQNSTIQSSNAYGSGGAIYNLGTLSVDQSSLLNNSATLSGGAIYNNGGVVTVTHTTFSVNSAGSGGAISQNGGMLTLSNSLLVGNVADTNGGGIHNFSDRMHLTNVTFAGNFADRGGGIDIASGATMTLTHGTLYINRADIGGGIFSEAGSSIRLENTIVATSLTRDGAFPSLNCDNGGSPVQSLGHNMSDDNSCNLAAAGDQPGVSDPKLGPLADNGGPTWTHMPLSGSPAIDGGQCVAGVTTDQRGLLRPAGAACDIGAVEAGAQLPQMAIFLPLVLR
jgi:predicted outer membrane repeat protein